MVSRFRICAIIFAMLFALTACGGGGGTSVLGAGSTSPGTSGTISGSAKVQFTFTYSTASASSSSGARAIVASAVRKPATISSDTQSLTVSVNGGTPQIFNAAPPTCSNNGTTVSCAFNIGAPLGADSFLILTYSGPNGTGTILNAAAVTLNVTQSGPNTASATAGTAIDVNSSADGSGGSYSCASGSTTCTLREAVAEASTTAGIYTALLFSGVTSVTVGSPITINGQNIIVLGPGATASNSAGVGAPLASGNLKISGGGTTQIFHVTAGSLAVDGITLTGGVSPPTCSEQPSYSCGGAIENYGTLSIVNTVFNANGNTSINYGGAVYDQSQVGATTAVAYSTFTGNAGQNGGAYYLEYYEPSGGGAAFSHCVFANNTASDGSIYGHGGAIYAAWNLSVDTSTFTGNVAGSASVSGFNGHGGAIDLAYDGQSPTITNSTFGGTSASAGNVAGGAGANDTGFGGAIANEANYPLVLGGDTFANNVSRGGYIAQGGAIADFQGVISTGDAFTNNVADASAATSGGSGNVGGGAVYSISNTSWTNDTFASNRAKGGSAANGSDGMAFGGAIDDANSEAALLFTTSQTTFSNNTASAPNVCYGGAVYAFSDSTSQIQTLANVQFTNNSCSASNSGDNAYALGGGLVLQYAPISLESVTFSGNTVSASASSPSYQADAFGGGFEYYSGFEGCGQNCSFKRRTPGPNPSAQSSKALALILAMSTRHPNPKDKHPVQTLARARAPMATRSVAQNAPSNGVDGSTFSNNNATASGTTGYAGGGGADFSGQPTVTNSTFSGNSATWAGPTNAGYAGGGGLSLCGFNGGQDITVTATVTGNATTNRGGGIYNGCSSGSVLTSTISGNSVTTVQSVADGGGGVYSAYGGLAIMQSTINGNSVAGSLARTGGGGLLSSYSTVTITNSTIASNMSSTDGGGIESFGVTQTNLINDTIYQNTATGNGGSISNQNDNGFDVVSIENTILAGGAAASGTEVDNEDTFVSLGGNLIQGSVFGNAIPAASEGIADLMGVNPLLATLANNGGPTLTISEGGTSPGKGRIPFSGGTCGYSGPSVDQRNFSRGLNSVCDIGSYEFSGTATTQSSARKR